MPFPLDDLQRLDEKLDQMIAETPDSPRLGELKNLKFMTSSQLHLLGGELSVELLKEATSVMRNVRDRVAELDADKGSAGQHDVAVKAMEAKEEKA